MFRRLSLLALLVLVWPRAADGAALRAGLPAVVRAGSVVVVRGLAPPRATVELRQRVRGRWVNVARSRLRSGSWLRFALRWRAPGRRSVVVLRVVARRSGRVVGASAPRRVAVTPTTVLSPGRIAVAPPPGAAGIVRYRGAAGRSLRAGAFVAAGVSPETPAGLLARVIAVRRDESDTVARVVPASLLDAVPAGELRLGRVASPSGAAARGPVRTRSFGLRLPCSGEGSGDVTGSLSVSLSPALELAWSSGSLRRLMASATLTGEAGLSASVDGRATCTLPETRLAGWVWPPLRATVGPIPVVIVPTTSLFASGEADVRGAASASVDGHVSATAGLRWDGSAVHHIGSFEQRLGWDAPLVSGGRGELGARVIPSITFLLYGQAGPRFDLSTGLRLALGGQGGEPGEAGGAGETGAMGATGATGAAGATGGAGAGGGTDGAGSAPDGSGGGTPWMLSAPVELRAGVVLPSFSGLTIPQQTVFSRTFPLASGGPPSLGPGSAAGSGSGTTPGSGSGSTPGSGSGYAPGSGSGPAPGSGSAPGSGTTPGSGSGSTPGSGTPPAGVERARITWDTDATDVDLHVWDAAGHHAWFRDPTAIPGGTLSEDDRHGFGPESFRDATAGGRPLTFGLCYFDDGGDRSTHVSVRLTDPDGSVRTSTVTLTRRGDHTLIGEARPPDGWCSP